MGFYDWVNSNGETYALENYSGRYYYASGKYYANYTNINSYYTYNSTNSAYPKNLSFTLYQSSVYSVDPWVRYINTDYYAPYNGTTTKTRIQPVIPGTFVNFRTKKLALELDDDTTYYLTSAGLRKASSTTYLTTEGYQLSANNIFILQGPGGNGGRVVLGNILGNKKFASGGGSGGCIELVLNPRYRAPTIYGGTQNVEYYILKTGVESVSGVFSNVRGLHLYMYSSQWKTTTVWLATAEAGGDGNTLENASTGGAAGGSYVNSNYLGYAGDGDDLTSTTSKAFWVLIRYTGIQASGIDKNYSSSYVWKAQPETKFYATNNSSYSTSDCTYNYITTSEKSGGTYDTIYQGALSYDAVTGGGAPSYFANGANGSTGSNIDTSDSSWGNASKGAGGGGVAIGSPGNGSTDVAGKGGKAYLEVYCY